MNHASTMNDDKQALLDQVDKDRDMLIEFLCRFIRAKSPNPPGDTREAAAHVTAFLDARGLEYRIIEAHPEMPNIVAAYDCGSPGKHLVLNGHMDVFPVNENETWTQPPWSGAIADGKIWGRGAADMKCGTTASIFTYAYLHGLRDKLKGKLTLTCVSDEETFGPYGARYLMEHHPEVHGDTLLNGEPGSPYTVRFGEKGPLWLKFTIRTRGAHGAYTHISESATKIAAKFIGELERVTDVDSKTPGNIEAVLAHSAEFIDKAQGAGAAEILQRVTLNTGVIKGGLKVNMVPSECTIEADIRLPVGITKDQVMAEIDQALAAFPQVSMEEINYNPPSWCDPEGEMLHIVRDNVTVLKGFTPEPIVSLGGTDARLWRYRDIPAYVYGPFPNGMGSFDEHVDIEEFLHIVRIHALSAYDYLARDR
ncbi:MAG: M20/M25/M40 family metallo-hydrolase [Alphaproteobacteria bacterium]|mgnify:CR=1 FL=1